MKHFLNFKPTIVFRKGSSFMMKTSLAILYAAPVALAFFWSYQYFSLTSITAFQEEAHDNLKSRIVKFEERLNQKQQQVEEYDSLEKQYFDYKTVAAVSQTSWSSVLNSLEKITPPRLRFKKINIFPEKLVKIRLEGEATDLQQITGLLQQMFNQKIFLNPELQKHRRAKAEGLDVIQFNLDVEYAGESGELP